MAKVAKIIFTLNSAKISQNVCQTSTFEPLTSWLTLSTRRHFPVLFAALFKSIFIRALYRCRCNAMLLALNKHLLRDVIGHYQTKQATFLVRRCPVSKWNRLGNLLLTVSHPRKGKPESSALSSSQPLMCNLEALLADLCPRGSFSNDFDLTSFDRIVTHFQMIIFFAIQNYRHTSHNSVAFVSTIWLTQNKNNPNCCRLVENCFLSRQQKRLIIKSG